MKKNTIGANPALAAILKSVKTTEKEYKTTQLQPKKKKSFDYKKVFKEKEAVKDRPIGLATKNNDILVNYYKTENKRLADKVSEITTVIVRAVEDLNHLIEAKEIEKSIIKTTKYFLRKHMIFLFLVILGNMKQDKKRLRL